MAPIAKERRNADLLKDKTLLTAFYQPSTRTRMATAAARHRLGGPGLGVYDVEEDRTPGRAEVPAGRRHADAHDALDPVRVQPVRRRVLRRRPAGDGAP